MSHVILSLVFQKTAYIVGIALLSSLILSIALSIGYCSFQRRWRATFGVLFFELLVILFPFSTIGIISGFLTGLSRNAAVTALIPAVLTFVGAVVAFQVVKSKSATVTASLATIFFSFFLLFGSLLGAAEREVYEARKGSLDQQLREVEIEFEVERYRKGLGLPPGKPRKAEEASPPK